MTDKIPHSEEAEQSVLGSIISDTWALKQTLPLLAPEDFYTPRHEVIYRAIGDMYRAARPIDPITINDWLASEGLIERVGGDLSYTHTLAHSVPSASNVAFYADIVKRTSINRMIIDTGIRITQLGYQHDGTGGASLAEAEKLVREVTASATAGGYDMKSLDEIMSTRVERKWLIPNVLAKKDRFFLTGPEGFGKTMLLRQMAIAAAAGIHPFTQQKIDPVKVLIFDAENSEEQWSEEAQHLVRSVKKLGQTDPGQLIQMRVGKRMDITKGQDLGRIHAELDKYNPDMIVIGPLYKLTNKAVNDDDTAAQLFVALDSIRERGIAMLVELHAGHAQSAAGDRNFRPRGSSALLGYPEVGISFSHTDYPDTTRGQIMRWRGDRGKRIIPSHFRWGDRLPWEEEVNAPSAY
ncbi:replicative DNA helicase [Rathayibacter phage NCPPB3778]|nr:replicative DNA helicase [Rathayibacter phage NCPPB3778]